MIDIRYLLILILWFGVTFGALFGGLIAHVVSRCLRKRKEILG